VHNQEAALPYRAWPRGEGGRGGDCGQVVGWVSYAAFCREKAGYKNPDLKLEMKALKDHELTNHWIFPPNW
jgi:hypothetical protein